MKVKWKGLNFGCHKRKPYPTPRQSQDLLIDFSLISLKGLLY